MKLLISVLLAIILSIPTIVGGQELSSHNRRYELSTIQKQWIKKYSQMYIGKNNQWPKIMEAIRMTECAKAVCGKSEMDEASWGQWQMQVGTARDAAKMIGLTLPNKDTEVINLLIHNDKISTMLACAYFGWLFKQLNSLDLALISYNSGIGITINRLKKGEQLPMEYLDKVKMKLNMITYGY